MLSYQSDIINGLLLVVLGFFVRMWFNTLTSRLDAEAAKLERMRDDLTQLEITYREKHAELVAMVLALREQMLNFRERHIEVKDVLTP